MDIIKLLPENIANQIAAGEVVQRPSSVVKELLENAIDASASNITLIVKDGGKQLIQVIDNGKGMSTTDARMSFERHATSKISTSEDLFAIKTLGFRGEALASIAAVAMVELKTKRSEDETGTRILIDNSMFKIQEPTSLNNGTNLSVKNLFFNVPARKNFLKSNTVEIKHIIDEFLRVALANPQVGMIMMNEEEEIFHLNQGNLKQRIIAIFGKKYNEGLIPIQEKTDIISLTGFVVKPEFAKKNRTDQYFFANGRYIKSPYLNHSINVAFSGLIPSDAFPGYFIFIEIPPISIDINVHPTKTEVKFQEEKAIYAYMNTIVRKALNQFHASPTLSFDDEPITGLGLNSSYIGNDPKKFQINYGNTLGQQNNQPLEALTSFGSNDYSKEGFNKFQNKSSSGDWKQLYKILQDEVENSNSKIEEEYSLDLSGAATCLQINRQYILTGIKSGLLIIHQQMASERILFEKYLLQMKDNNSVVIQKTMFPEMIEMELISFLILKDLIPEFSKIGLEIEEFGKNTVMITGSSAEISISKAKFILESIIHEIHEGSHKREDSYSLFLAKQMASKSSIQAGQILTTEQMQAIIDQLFACQEPYFSPYGKPVMISISNDELTKKFRIN